MNGSFPSVLIVHGAWHKPEHFRLLVDELWISTYVPCG